MSIFVICPSCSNENFGSALYCKTCQTSLVGVPRQQRPDPEPVDASPQNILDSSTVSGNAVSVAQPVISMPSSTAGNYLVMLNEIRSWGLWSLGLGALHIFTSGFLSAPWGILLIIVGLASFYFRSASMFIIYASTLAWAAFSNLISFEIGWVIFALYQFYLAYRVFRQYRIFRDAEGENNTSANPDAMSSPSPASRLFPWFSPLFGCSSIISFVVFVLIVFIVVIGSEGTATVPDYFVFIEGLIVNFAVLGVAIGLASLLSKYNKKGLAIVGLIAGILTILLEYALVFLL